MKVLIIEDEDLAAGRLMQLLKEEIPEISISGPIDTVKNAVIHLSANRDYDLIFLDIQLADGKCFSIFEQVNIDIPIIFTTAYDEYAIKAFELNSIDYLLKPIQKERFKNSLEKYRNLKGVFEKQNILNEVTELFTSLKQQTKAVYQSRFLVNKGDSLLPISTSDIAYFYAEDKVVFLSTNENLRYIVNFSLEELEPRLDPQRFFRVNRQYIVSVDSIRKVHYYFNYKLKLELSPETLSDVVVSKTRTNDFRKWMNG